MSKFTSLLVISFAGSLALTAQTATNDKGAVVAEPPVIGARDPLYGTVATSTKPQTPQERFTDYSIEAFGPRALMRPALSAGFRMLRPRERYPREWKDGAGAFGRNYGDALAARTSELTARYLVGALLHEDFRYRPSASKSPVIRIAHAIAYTFVDRSDAGNSRLAVANFAAAGANGLVRMAYLPPGYNDISHAGTGAMITFGQLAGQNLAREFAPDLFRSTRKFHLPFPRVPLPEWWVKR